MAKKKRCNAYTPAVACLCISVRAICSAHDVHDSGVSFPLQSFPVSTPSLAEHALILLLSPCVRLSVGSWSIPRDKICPNVSVTLQRDSRRGIYEAASTTIKQPLNRC